MAALRSRCGHYIYSRPRIASAKAEGCYVLVVLFITGSIAQSATCRYLIYSEADFKVFRPAGATRCTDLGEIWHGGGDLPSSVPNFAPIGATVKV